MQNILKFLVCDQTVKITCIDTTELVKKAQKIHELELIPTKVMGELLTLGAILGADLKDETESLTLQVDTNGELGKIICVAKSGAKVKGYMQNPKANTGEMFGNLGTMHIIKDLGLKEPYVGVIQIENANISEAITKYFVQSEQIPTAISLGVLFDDNGEILKAGGYMVQLMPDATEDTAALLEKNISTTGQMTKQMEDGKSLFNIAQMLSGEEELMMLVGEISNDYVCDCSRERMEKGLISLGKKELEEILEEGNPIETKCQFCNKAYNFELDEIKKLYEEAI